MHVTLSSELTVASAMLFLHAARCSLASLAGAYVCPKKLLVELAGEIPLVHRFLFLANINYVLLAKVFYNAISA